MAKRSRTAPVELALVGELSEENERDLLAELLEVKPKGRVTLFIDSPGGSVYSALALANFIAGRKLTVAGVVLSECSSAALLLFAACQERYVAREAIFLFHRMRWRGEKDLRHEEALHWAAHFKELEVAMDKMQLELFDNPDPRMAEWINEGRYVPAAELVKMGVAKWWAGE